ncbi:MAG: hypothetical protein ACOYMS_03065 [Terrimicrobiaceae bacterium]
MFPGRGVGRALLDRALTAAAGVECIGLDATPAGRPLYEKKGGRVVADLSRWEGNGLWTETGPSGTLSDDLLSLDRSVFGCDRETWLRRVAGRSALVAGAGYVGLLRAGAKAWYLGPLVARSGNASIEAIERLLPFAHGQKVYWDSPDLAFASPSQWGFTRQCPIYRMMLGKTLEQKVSHMIAIADPSTG